MYIWRNRRLIEVARSSRSRTSERLRLGWGVMRGTADSRERGEGCMPSSLAQGSTGEERAPGLSGRPGEDAAREEREDSSQRDERDDAAERDHPVAKRNGEDATSGRHVDREQAVRIHHDRAFAARPMAIVILIHKDAPCPLRVHIENDARRTPRNTLHGQVTPGRRKLFGGKISAQARRLEERGLLEALYGSSACG